ncbi:MAG: diguanylate cyclase, partial [Planctomycetaceae bacterium]
MNATNSNRTLVMVIADSTAVSAVRCTQLAMVGHQTMQVDNIEEARYALETRQPAVVLLMPGGQNQSSMNWLAQLRNAQPFAYLPILVEVPAGNDAMRCEYLEHGADSVISPQTSPKEFVAGIRALLRAKELHDALSASRQELQNSLQRERKLMAKLKTDNADLRQQCQTDPLTHATNAESYRRMLEHDFHLSKRYNHTLSLLVIDVDRFKNVNDTYGHPCGDMVLKELTVILQRAVRQADVVARTGGEEFAV